MDGYRNLDSLRREILRDTFGGPFAFGRTILTYDWPSNGRYKRKRWRSRCQFRVELMLLFVWPFLSLSLSLFLSVNRGTWHPRCCGRAVSYVYTGCLVIKSPHGVVSLTSYTPSRNRCGNGGRGALYQCPAESPS